MVPLPRWLRSRTPKDPLDQPLFFWNKQDAFTWRMAMENILITGQTGSGKTSASGQTIACSMLRAGWGGLVLTAKPGELDLWRSYAARCDRSDDIMVFDAAATHRFNFLDFEMSRPGPGGGITENIVLMLCVLLEIAERNASQGSGNGEQYWVRAVRQLIRNAVDLLAMAKGRVSVGDLYRVVVSAPTEIGQLASEPWKEQSDCFRWLSEADKRLKTPREEHDFRIVTDYWCNEYPRLSDKTRSSITSMFTSMIDVLHRGVLRELFSTDTTITPQAVEDGKVIVVDLSAKEFGEVGVIASLIWKHTFQRSIERRDVNASTRPVFLWADEAQHFLTSYDASFVTTCRSARVSTIFLTQNFNTIIAAMGGSEKGRAEAESLASNLNTKILHANSDPVTNEWASGLIGKTLQVFANGSSQQQDDPQTLLALAGLERETTDTAGWSQSYELQVQPNTFSSTLRTGGPGNKHIVDAIVIQSGRLFKSNGRTWMPVQFDQRQA